ncbi:MAG: putative toxin-antitoxin system toxin component, PIN family [Bacillota bacterium]
MRVVVDTNVLISGLISALGPPAIVVDAWLEGTFEVAVSPPIITEYLAVFLRPKFDGAGSPDVRRETVEQMIALPNTIVVVPEARSSRISEDPSDNQLPDCAKSAGADLIVSGDQHLLSLGIFEGIPIMNPRQFVELLRG